SIVVLSVTLAIFLIVGGLLLYALIRFRHRPSDSEHEPAQIYGSNQIELSWTVIPILIVVMLFLSTTRVILETEAIPKPASALDVTVIGHQFWWEYRYPASGVVTANKLHIPTPHPPTPPPPPPQGQPAFTPHARINCPPVAGTVATGRFGPDLTHLASRDTLASGPIQNTPENIRKWVDDPNTLKPGSFMPAMHLNNT